MLSFGMALDRLRASVQRDLKRPGLPREKVLALVVKLLDSTRVRVGNAEYARSNGSRRPSKALLALLRHERQ